jgi:hypothetical protein
MLGKSAFAWQNNAMSEVTIHLPEPLDATLMEQMKDTGAKTKEEYLLRLVEFDCAAGALERILTDRMGGPFAPLEADWKDRVRSNAVGA